MISTRISSLSFHSCPAAVGWFVISASILSFNGQTLGVSVRKSPVIKRAKIVFPFFAHTNPVRSVISKLIVLLVVAPAFHCTPHAKQWMAAFSVRDAARFFASTSTRSLRMKSGRIDASDCPANALTHILASLPCWSTVTGCKIQDGPLAKFLPRAQNDFTHDDTFHVRLRETPGSDNCRGVSHFTRSREVVQCPIP